MEFLDEEGNRRSAPAVSGRMLKHWHYEGMKHLINNKDLCDACRIGEPMRPGILDKEKLSQIKPEKLKDEENFVKKCAVCDIHGDLIAQEAK